LLVSAQAGHVGCEWHQLVILPLPGQGGNRCSVNPASRCALLFKEPSDPELSHKPLDPVLAWNGRVSK
jgi:hypothetical protein